MSPAMLDDLTQPGPVPRLQPIRFLEDPDAVAEPIDPAALMLT